MKEQFKLESLLPEQQQQKNALRELLKARMCLCVCQLV